MSYIFARTRKFDHLHYYFLWLILVLTILLSASSINCHDEITGELPDREKNAEVEGRKEKFHQFVNDVYKGCGFIKTCLKICAEEETDCRTCINEHSCRAIVTLHYDHEKFLIKMFRRLSENMEFISFGISEDDKMGSDAMFTCVTDSKKFNHFAAFSTAINKNLEYSVTDNENGSGIPQNMYYKPAHVVLTDDEYNVKYYLCEFRIKSSFTMKNIEFDLDTNKYYLFGSSGEASDFFTLAGHAQSKSGRTSSPVPFYFKEVLEEEDYDERFDKDGEVGLKSCCLLISLLSLILIIIL